MRRDEGKRGPLAPAPDRALWRHCASLDATEDDAERFLDLAAFADGRLDPDERDRVAERLTKDPAAAGDIAAARALADEAAWPAIPEPIVASACALVQETAAERGNIVAFPPRRSPPTLRGVARWASLAAAIMVAGWLGFSLGSETSVPFGPTGVATDEDGLLRDLLDPPTGFLRDLTEGVQT